jgi:hypothetical protein
MYLLSVMLILIAVISVGSWWRTKEADITNSIVSTCLADHSAKKQLEGMVSMKKTQDSKSEVLTLEGPALATHYEWELHICKRGHTWRFPKKTDKVSCNPLHFTWTDAEGETVSAGTGAICLQCYLDDLIAAYGPVEHVGTTMRRAEPTSPADLLEEPVQTCQKCGSASIGGPYFKSAVAPGIGIRSRLDTLECLVYECNICGHHSHVKCLDARAFISRIQGTP